MVQTHTPPCELVDQLPLDLEANCLKCLEIRPEDRYQSAQELAEDLRHYLKREMTTVRPWGVAERAKRWVRRHPVAGALSAVAPVLLIAATTISVSVARARETKLASEVC